MATERKDFREVFGLEKISQDYKKNKDEFIAIAYKIAYEIMKDVGTTGLFLFETEIEISAVKIYNENIDNEHISIFDKMQILKNLFLFKIIRKSMISVIRKDKDMQDLFGIYQPHVLRNDLKILYFINTHLSNINFLVLFYFAVENLKHKNFNLFIRNLNKYFSDLNIPTEDIDKAVKSINSLPKTELIFATKYLISSL